MRVSPLPLMSPMMPPKMRVTPTAAVAYVRKQSFLSDSFLFRRPGSHLECRCIHQACPRFVDPVVSWVGVGTHLAPLLGIGRVRSRSLHVWPAGLTKMESRPDEV